jgi:phosphoglycolate phosphatase-like HAD superfamily hydrolase
MMDNTETTIIFDLDGTLIESASDNHHAVNEILTQIGTAKLSLEKPPLLLERRSKVDLVCHGRG